MASLANEFKALRGVVTQNRGTDSPGLLERRASRQPRDLNVSPPVEAPESPLRNRPKDKPVEDPWGRELKYSKAVDEWTSSKAKNIDTVDLSTFRNALELRDGELWATDLKSGELRWKTRLYDGDDRRSAVVRIGKEVQVIDRNRGRLVGIDPESGKVLWTKEIKKRNDGSTSDATSSNPREVRSLVSRVAALKAERDALAKRVNELNIQIHALYKQSSVPPSSSDK